MLNFIPNSFMIIGKIKPSIQSRNDNVRYIRGSGEAYLQIGDKAIIKEGFTVKISCPFSAVPIGKLSWLRNGKDRDFNYHAIP